MFVARTIDAACDVIASLSYVEQVGFDDDGLTLTTDPARTADINRALAGAGIAELSELHWERAALEEVFLELTQTP